MIHEDMIGNSSVSLMRCHLQTFGEFVALVSEAGSFRFQHNMSAQQAHDLGSCLITEAAAIDGNLKASIDGRMELALSTMRTMRHHLDNVIAGRAHDDDDEAIALILDCTIQMLESKNV